jgi:hypothetical protein
MGNPIKGALGEIGKTAIGAFEDFVLPLGRELFGFQIRANKKIADIAEQAGVTMDTLRDAPPEALSAVLDRAARQGAIDPRDANSINIQIAQEAQEAVPAMPTLKVDNPGGDWLAGKLRRALEKRQSAEPNTYQSTLGSGEGVTGYFREPLALNPNLLADIPGSLGEEMYRPDQRKIDNLRQSIAEDGYDDMMGTILVEVREDGVPFVVEGNHRIIEGIESGRPTIPVEIKYLRGAEDVDGPLSPAALGVPR